MESGKLGFICMLLIALPKRADAAIGTDCSANADCDAGNNEVCDATPDTDSCACDSNNSYVASSNDANVCVKDCGSPTDPTGYTLRPSAGNQEGETADVACATGYNGAPVPAAVACQADGTWASPSGCAIGASDVGVSCAIDDQCVAGDGGVGTVCDSTCKKDCGSPTNPTGYTLTLSGGAGDTLTDDTASVACATGYAGPPSSATVACQADGTWAAPAGCTIDAKNLGETCDIDEQCATGDGGAGAVCDPSDSTCKAAKNLGETCDIDEQCAAGDGGAGAVCDPSDSTCKAGNGASEIRQQFSFLILIGSLVIALM